MALIFWIEVHLYTLTRPLLNTLPGWDDKKAAVFEDPYEKKLREMKTSAANKEMAANEEMAPGSPLREGGATSTGSSPWGSQVPPYTIH